MKFYLTFILLLTANCFCITHEFIQAPVKIQNRASKLYDEGKYCESVEFLLAAVNSYPDDETVIMYLADSYLKLDRYDEAESWYLEYLKRYPDNSAIKLKLTDLYYKLIYIERLSGNYNTAFDVIKKAEYYLPKNSDFYSIDAYLNMEINNFFQAKNYWKKSFVIANNESESIKDIWKLRKIGECALRLTDKDLIEWRDFVYDLYKKNETNNELALVLADAYFYNEEKPAKRNNIRNKVMKSYLENNERDAYHVDFPLKGNWYVTSGYFEKFLDTHNGYNGYCIDLVKFTNDYNIRLKEGDGSKNSDYLSFGETIYSVADGTVVFVQDFTEDNSIGIQNRISTNLIKILHTNDSGKIYYSLYVHIKKNSAVVKVGDNVKSGEKIALVGNSGYSFAPHLHFGLYDANNVSIPVFFDDTEVFYKDKPLDNYDEVKKSFVFKKNITAAVVSNAPPAFIENRQ